MLRTTLAYSSGAFAAGMFLAFNAFTLPYVMQDNALTLARFFPLLAPLFGIWSDRVPRRASFALGAMLVAALLLLVAGFLVLDPGLYFVSVFAMMGALLAFNIGSVPYTALLADLAPTQVRGAVNGAANAFGFLGQMALLVGAFLLFGISPTWVFALVAAALLLGFAVVAQSETLSRQEMPRGVSDYNFNHYVLGLFREHPDAMKLIVARFLYAFGIGALLAFLPAFLATQIGMSGWSQVIAVVPSDFNASLAKIDPRGLSQVTAVVLLVATGSAAFPFGWLGDKVGKKNILMLGLIVCALAAFFIASAEDVPQVLGYLFAFGIGNAALAVLFFPYLSTLVPVERYGEFAGLGAFGEGAALLLAFPIANAFVTVNFFQMQYRSVLALCAVVTALAWVVVLFVRSKERVGSPPNKNSPGGKDA